MFTGIVSRLGRVISVDRQSTGAGELWIELDPWVKPFEGGESIAVDGVCLSVVEIDSNRIRFDVLNETFELTILKNISEGTAVNLERALLYGDAMGGHIVSGHVDNTGKVQSITEVGRDWMVTVACSKDLAAQMIHKGSITINGVSLTLTSVFECGFSVHLIPITRSDTNLGSLTEGAEVNLELDILGKYAKRLLGDEKGCSSGLSWDTLGQLNKFV